MSFHSFYPISSCFLLGSDNGNETYNTAEEVDNSVVNSSVVNASNVEVPETDTSDDEDEIPQRRKGATRNRIVSDDESSDEEEKIRHSFYLAEKDAEEEPPIEEMAYSKLTRRSIDPSYARRSTAVLAEDESSSDDESILIEDSEEEVSQQKSETGSKDLRVTGPLLSSSIRSPLREVFNNTASNASFNSSIGTKMSSTVSYKEDSHLLDEAAGGAVAKDEKINVSRSDFESAVLSKEQLEKEVERCLTLLNMAQQLPDRGVKIQLRLNTLLTQLDEKKILLDSLKIDESLGIKNEIAKSFQSSLENSAVSINDSIVVVDDIIKSVEAAQPKFTGKIGLQNFQYQQALTVDKLEDIQQSIDERPLETELETPPKHLKVDLMNHQLHALKFMLWRERKKPRGGILAGKSKDSRSSCKLC